MTYRVPIGKDVRGNITRVDNALNGISHRLEEAQIRLETLEQQRKTTQEELGKPLPQEAEYAEKSARLAELDAQLSMDETGPSEPAEEEQNGEERRSVLADLKEKTGQIIPPADRRGNRCAEEVI